MKTFQSSLEWKKFCKENEYKKAKKDLQRINRNFWINPKKKQHIKGKCGVCLATLGFTIDSKHAISNDLGGLSSIFLKKKVNFRERMECSNCHLNQRMRSAVGLVDSLLKRKDSAIWISVTPVLGIEVARLLVTNDSVKMMNRLNSTYFTGNFKLINKLFNADIDYDMFQSFLVGNDFTYYENGASGKFKANIENKQYCNKIV